MRSDQPHGVVSLDAYRERETAPAVSKPECPLCGTFRHDSALCESCDALVDASYAVEQLTETQARSPLGMALQLTLHALHAVNRRVIANEYSSGPPPSSV